MLIEIDSKTEAKPFQIGQSLVDIENVVDQKLKRRRTEHGAFESYDSNWDTTFIFDEDSRLVKFEAFGRATEDPGIRVVGVNFNFTEHSAIELERRGLTFQRYYDLYLISDLNVLFRISSHIDEVVSISQCSEDFLKTYDDFDLVPVSFLK